MFYYFISNLKYCSKKYCVSSPKKCTNIQPCKVKCERLYNLCINCSSCSFHTALAIKGLDYDYKAVNLIQDGGQQVAPDNIYYIWTSIKDAKFFHI